jgi:hypothetical protein
MAITIPSEPAAQISLLRRRFQYRVRTVLLFTTVVAMASGLLMRERRRIAERSAEIGAYCQPFCCGSYCQPFPSQPAWRIRLLGYDLPGYTTWFSFHGETVTDATFAHLEGLTQLENIYCTDVAVTDAGLAHLEGLTQLQ